MKPLRNILIIAKFESRTLFRSWFFRIFALVGIFILSFFNIAQLLDDNSRWWIRSISSVMPYINIIILNIAQGIIASFLASEFLKRDRKLDTTEVIYIRSMSNGEYVLGKTVGILYVFLALNALILLIAGIINMLFEDVTVSFISYLLYPLLISIPTLIFVLGVAFLLMILLKNQAVTFVALLGLMAGCLFYLSDKYNYAFDFLAFSYPMVKSDIIGFSEWGALLTQRGYFLFIGLGFIFLCVLLLNRLEQSKTFQSLSLILSITFLLTGGFLLFKHLNTYNVIQERRATMLNLNNEYAGSKGLTITHSDINLSHQGKEISAKATLKGLNSNTVDINPIFRLNPGLEIISIKDGSGNIDFQRKEHVVVFDKNINPGEKVEFIIEYEGIIDEAACYLDTDDIYFETNRRNAIYNVNKNYAFITDNYVLLTPEALWYPMEGISYSREKSWINPPGFINFTLDVTTRNGLMALSQGEVQKSGKRYSFQPENPLMGISLTIGNYEEHAIIVDSIKYAIYNIKGHNYYEKHFSMLTDTLPSLITEIKDDFERPLMTEYPFKRFSVVEVPVQFISYPRRHTIAREVSQPEMVFMPEKGAGILWADLEYRTGRLEERNKQRGGEMTEVEIQSQVFKQFFSQTVTSSQANNFFGNQIFRTNYSAFPNYYSYTNYIESKEWPYFNRLFETYIYSQIKTENVYRFWFNNNNDMEEASVALQKKTLDELLIDTDQELFENIIKAKADYVFTMLKGRVGEEIFAHLMNNLLKENRFSQSPFNTFSLAIDSVLSNPSSINELISSTGIPAFLASNVRYSSFKDGDYSKYHVSIKVSNVEKADGIIIISYNLGGGGRGGRVRFRGGGNNQENSVEQIVELKKGQTKIISKILVSEPRSVTINTLLSKNLPFEISFELSNPTEINRQLSEEIVLSDDPIKLTTEGEIIVDNEDPGFMVDDGGKGTPIRAFITAATAEEEDDNVSKYSGLSWRAPPVWTPTLHTGYYGDIVRSAHYIKSGEGDSKATWQTTLEESGNYDIYVWISRDRATTFRRGGDNNNTDKYHYNVQSDDGLEEIVLEMSSITSGWNLVGTFYISEGNTKIELSNKSEARHVIADAVKWVKR